MLKVDELAEMIAKSTGGVQQTAVHQLVELASKRSSAISALLNLCVRGILKNSDFDPYADAVFNLWKHAHEAVLPFQREPVTVEWLLDDEYEWPRCTAEWILDLLGYIPGPECIRSLRISVKLLDPRLKMFAALSLLRHSETVDPEDLERVAASHEVREILWEELGKLGRRTLMPDWGYSPVALAASALCRWLTHPNELNAIPEEIQLMMVFPIEIAEGEFADAYLFRFREFPKPWEPGEGWMAGIAGPCKNGEVMDGPWSSFKRWDSMSPEEHFDRMYYRGCPVQPRE